MRERVQRCYASKKKEEGNLDLKEERNIIIGTSLWFYKGEGREASYSPRLSGTGDEEKYRHKSSLSGLRAGRKGGKGNRQSFGQVLILQQTVPEPDNP